MFEKGHPQYNTGRTHFKKGHNPWNGGLSKELDERIAKIGNRTKGRIAWNKGLTKEKDIRIKGYSESCSKTKKGTHLGKDNPFFGKHHTEKTKEKMREALKGRSAWNKGLKGNYPSEYSKKSLRRRIPSSLEEKFQDIVDKYSLPYRYVGNGKFFIENLNPDFINTNSEKIAIEVYARYYKLRNSVSIKEWKEKRSKIFGEYGWKVIYFDETEVTESNVLKCLGVRIEN